MKKRSLDKVYSIILIIIGLMILTPILIFGFDYYTTELSHRFFHVKHEMLKPSGFIGHGLGIIGTIMITVGVITYIIRKRIRKLTHYGPLKYWLYFHIFMCSVGPGLIILHSTLKFNGIAAISFWSMIIVVLSGMIGRVIYLQIPRTIQGEEISIGQLKNDYNRTTDSIESIKEIPLDILTRIENLPSHDYFNKMKLVSIIPGIIKANISNKQLLKDIKSNLISNNVEKHKVKNIVSLLRSRITLSRRIGLLTSMHKLFKYWHIAHLPFALIMLAMVILHVTVTLLMGYTWIWYH